MHANQGVTISDIAKACGLSRNTVPKVFNNRGSVPEKARKRVLLKAQELGYESFFQTASVDLTEARQYCRLNAEKLAESQFWRFLYDKLCQSNLMFGSHHKIYEISSEEIAQQTSAAPALGRYGRDSDNRIVR